MIYDTMIEEDDELVVVVPGGLVRVRAGTDALEIQVERSDEAVMGPVRVSVP